MNLSGGTALQLSRRYTSLLSTKRLLVLHDDLTLSPLRSRGQFGGSEKGHNGIRDVVARLKTKEFHRWKIGIGRPEDAGSKMTVADWCLSPIGLEEMEACSPDGKVTLAAWQYLATMAQANPN